MKIWVYREYGNGTLHDKIADNLLGFRWCARSDEYPKGYADPCGWGYTRKQAIRRFRKAVAKKPFVERELVELIEDEQ